MPRVMPPTVAPIVAMRDVTKTFRTPKRHAGRLGALRTLVTRDYQVTRAVDGVSFDIESGELVGYIGPNGAGKSTTIKILTGILEPTTGEVSVAGVVPWRRREANARNIGVVFGQRSQLWWDLPLIDTFELVRRMYAIEPDHFSRNLDQFRELLGLDEFIDTPVRQLSLGQRMRGELTAALLHDPVVVYLDEPTVGLDVVAKERIRTFIQETNAERGTTVVLTTHDLADVERLCSRIILIDHGRVLFDGTIAALKAKHAPFRELVAQVGADLGDGLPAGLENFELVGRDPSVLRLRFDPTMQPVHVAVAQVARALPVTDIAIVEPELESIVREIYERRDDAETSST